MTLGMNISGLIQASNDAANAMLRCFCVLCANQMTDDFIEHVLNASDLEAAVASSTIHSLQLMFTAFQDCNDAVVDAITELGAPALETLLHVTREAISAEESEMFSYIEKAMSSRIRILPLELKPTMMDVVGSTIKLFVKNVLEEIRSNVIFEYQYHNVIINLAFVLSMSKALLMDVTELRNMIEEVVKTGYERCFGPTLVEEDIQKKAIQDGMDAFEKDTRS